MSANKGMNKQIVICSYKGILHSDEKELNHTDMCCNMNESQKHNVEEEIQPKMKIQVV